MSYTVTTIFPEEVQSPEIDRHIRVKRQEEVCLEAHDVANLYDQYLISGYRVGITFSTDECDEGDNDPFLFAQGFDEKGIRYKAALSIEDKGSYDRMKEAVRLVEMADYPLKVMVDMNINEDSPVNFDRESTWFDPLNVEYRISAKAKADSIAEIKGLYEDLQNANYHPIITVKPVKPKDADKLADLLNVYTSGTKVKFTLKD